MRSAMHAASQLPGGEPTDVDDAPAPAMMMMIMMKNSSLFPYCIMMTMSVHKLMSLM